MIKVHSLAFGSFQQVEPLNRDFSPGHRKLKLTVDTETRPSVPDQHLLERLAEAFPGLTRHQCRAQEDRQARRAAGTRILLLDQDPSANQAHLLEHLMLEMLSALDHVPRLSGVTCAYASPPERNDVFVECAEPESGGFATLIAVEAFNAALAGEPLAPLYGDVVHCARVARASPLDGWTAARLSRQTGIRVERAAAALEVLRRASLVEPEDYALNLSGEPHYRFVGAGGGARSA